MLYETESHFRVSDVEEWMWERASTRQGYWTIVIPLRTGRKLIPNCCTGEVEEVIKRRVNLTQKEYALLDKVISNQIYSEPKVKVHRAVVYQRSLQLWDRGDDDDVTMRTLGAWAVSCYKCQGNKFRGYSAESTGTCWGDLVMCYGLFGGAVERKHRVRLERTRGRFVATGPEPEATEGDTDKGSPPSDDEDDSGDKKKASPKNKLGYQKAGEEYVNEHKAGSNNGDDAEIRATVEGRIVRKDCGVGVVGQTTNDQGTKQICGVLSQPLSVEPNVYAQEFLNARKAIEERIEKKQLPFAGNDGDKLKIKRMVYQSTHGKRHAPFSAKKVLDLLHTLIYDEIKSKKWTSTRMTDTIEGLCREIDPKFKLKAAVKLEPMPEEKAPRLLIADEDRGQVMALMTIYCIESLIKKHFPEKGIKGMEKRDALMRVMEACRAPRKVAKKSVTVFEGDGSAWDTTCSAKIRELVENPVINHVANLVTGFMNADPQTWALAHASLCAQEKLDILYLKNKEMQKFTIDAIRRSGHRGTSCLNWWVNFVGWHCAVFEDPELFLDPGHRYGTDVTGVNRWMNSAFEGDDSFLVTSPKIEPGKELHKGILQFWERIGFNMKIEIRKDRALFVGYYIGLDDYGPLFDKEKDEWMLMPEIDRCFSRAGTSCSPTMIEAFKADDRATCVKLAGSAAMSRAYEFAGLCPTISFKFLEYAQACGWEFTHDLNMRTHLAYDDKDEMEDDIRAMNNACWDENKLLKATGFWCSEDEKGNFIDYMWDYDRLADWEGFRDSLPATWRQ